MTDELQPNKQDSQQSFSDQDEFVTNKALFMSHPLFEQWPDGLIVIDDSGVIFAINEKTKELLGYEPEELEDRSLHSILCGQAADYQHNEESCHFIHVGNKLPINHIIDAWFIQKNGIYLHVDVKNVVSLFEQEFSNNADENKANYSVLSFQDCSTRRYSEKELQRLALFAELNPSPIIEFNEQALIHFSNPAMVALIAELGFDDNGLPCALPDNIQSLISKCLSSGMTLNNIEVESDGRWFLWNFHPVLESSLVQGYGMDITWRKEAEEELI